jgi:hypothetical protein
MFSTSPQTFFYGFLDIIQHNPVCRSAALYAAPMCRCRGAQHFAAAGVHSSALQLMHDACSAVHHLSCAPLLQLLCDTAVARHGSETSFFLSLAF